MKLQGKPVWTQGSGKRTEPCKEEICFERYHHSDFGNCLQAAGEESLLEVDKGHGELSGAPLWKRPLWILESMSGRSPRARGAKEF